MSILRRRPIITWLQMHPAAWSGWPSRDQQEPSEDQWARTVRLVESIEKEAPHAFLDPQGKRPPIGLGVVNESVFCRLTTLINLVRRHRRASYAEAVGHLHLLDEIQDLEVSIEDLRADMLTTEPVEFSSGLKLRAERSIRRRVKPGDLQQLGLFPMADDDVDGTEDE